MIIGGEEEKEFGRREGLYAAKDLRAGQIVESSCLEIKRPALGLRARYATKISGAKMTCDLAQGTPLRWEHLTFKEKMNG